jgi:hypothetical protein
VKRLIKPIVNVSNANSNKKGITKFAQKSLWNELAQLE